MVLFCRLCVDCRFVVNNEKAMIVQWDSLVLCIICCFVVAQRKCIGYRQYFRICESVWYYGICMKVLGNMGKFSLSQASAFSSIIYMMLEDFCKFHIY